MSRTPRLEAPRVLVTVEPRAIVRDRARSRARVLAAGIVFALVAIAARGAALCLDPDDEVLAVGRAQRYATVVMRADRGDVFDRRGRRLATSVATPSVAVDPKMFEEMFARARVTPDERAAMASAERHRVAIDVARILGLSPADVEAEMQRDARYVKLAGLVHPQVAARIDGLDHPAVWTHLDPHRYYPEETLAAQLIGFVDSAGRGQAGLEQSLDRYLRGGSVVVQRRRDRRGLDVDRPAEVDLDANQGHDVWLTIDRQIQFFAEEALAEAAAESQPKAASALVVDVKTGDILAMANWPPFNPNTVGAPDDAWKNHLVVDAIEPGSIFKPFTIAAAVEEGLVEPESKIDCEGGSWAIGRARVRDDHPHGVVTLGEVMKYSSNIGSAKLAFKVGAPKFIDYLLAFGFADKTGVPIPGERIGRVRSADSIKPIELATTAFGQGTTATPLQLVMGIAALANEGLRMAPRLVTKVVDVHGVTEWEQSPTPLNHAVSAATAHKVTEMMALVTEAGGTGTRARIEGYRVGGKTGTAQKVEDGRYGDKRIGSFIGFVPVEDPAITVIVIIDEPSVGSRYGGIVAAPAFSRLSERTLRYLGIAPNPDLIDSAPPNAPKRDPAPQLAALEPSESVPVRLAWAHGAWTVPDLAGHGVRDVLAGFEGTGVKLDVRGSGVVVAQDPPAGGIVPPGGTLSVTFRSF